MQVIGPVSHQQGSGFNESNETIIIRDFSADDKSFVYSTFLKGVFYGGCLSVFCSRESFYRYYPRVLDCLLSDSDVHAKVAVLESDPSYIVGWALYEPVARTIHFVYVKELWRHKGVAKQLLPSTPFENYTHQTKPGKSIGHKNKLTFEPLRLIFNLTKEKQ